MIRRTETIEIELTPIEIYDNFKSAKDLAERLAKKTGETYYIFERIEVVNCVGVVDGERKER